MATVIHKKATAICMVLGLLFGSSIACASAFDQDVPAQLKPPVDEKLAAEAHAKGFQIYTCKNDGSTYGWTLKGPDAELFDKAGEKVGRHFAGPTWEWSDHSQVTAKIMTSAPSPEADSIPWLLLVATGHSGKGILANVTNIQRLNTKGGKPPVAGCDAEHSGQETRAGYTADYFFYGK